MSKTIFRILFILFVIFFLSCQSLELRKTHNRPYTPYPLSQELKERIRHDVVCMDAPMEVCRYSCALTAELLSFSEKNDIPNGKANCVGYAQLSSTIFNYAIKIVSDDIEDSSLLKIKAYPVVGTVHLIGIDLTKLSQKILPKKYRPFFKDHDFMEVDYGNDTVLIDACLYDLVGYNNLGMARCGLGN